MEKLSERVTALLDLVLNNEVTIEMINEYISTTFESNFVKTPLCKRSAETQTDELVVEMEAEQVCVAKRQKQDEQEIKTESALEIIAEEYLGGCLIF